MVALSRSTEPYSKVTGSDSKMTNGLAALNLLTRVITGKTGGVDGTRTRDPRRDRPVTEPMNGAAFAHFSKTKFGPNLAALPPGVQWAIPTKRGLK
jgi:hypothetical protein